MKGNGAPARIGMFAPSGLLERGQESARVFLAQAGKAGVDHICCADHVRSTRRPGAHGWMNASPSCASC